MSVTCFVSYELHPTTMGGAGVLIHHAAEALLAAGHEVVFLLDVPPGSFEQLLRQDLKKFPGAEAGRVRAYRVEELAGGLPLTGADFECVFQWKSYQFAAALAALCKREAIDFVEYFEYCGAGYYSFVDRLFSEDRGGPVLGSRLHGSLEILDRYGQGSVRDRDRYVMQALERRGLAMSEVVLAPSRTYYERYYRELYGIEPQRVIVSSPPKQAFPRVSRRPSATGEFSIAFLGRMFHLKGVDQLVNAAVMLMKRRPEWTFNVDLIGYDSVDESVPGSYAAYLRTLMPAGLRGRFRFLGQLSHAEVAERLNEALFAVFPNRVESFCYALHEVYDAGVPVVVNDLPAFGDFFTHEKNALVYDGTTAGLSAAMERMIADGGLRERLCRPWAVAEGGVGEFYERPRALRGIVSGDAAKVEPLVVVLGRDADIEQWPVMASLRAQSVQPARVVCLCPAAGEAGLRWLGRAWDVRGVDGGAVEVSDLLTLDELAVLESDDELDAAWLEVCARGLGRSNAAFAGTWVTRGGKGVPSVLDVAPELWPFEQGAGLARVLLRTQPGVLLAELLDPSLGGLGHTGLLWGAVARWGHGHLWARGMVEVGGGAVEASSGDMQAVLLRFGGAFAERLMHVAGMMSTRAQGKPVSRPTTEQKISLADELGGSLLAKMAIKKMVKRAKAGGRRPT